MNIILGMAHHLHWLSKTNISDMRFVSFSDVQSCNLTPSKKCASPRDLPQFKCNDIFPLSKNLRNFGIVR
jgi:hypothetical protein